MGECVRCSSKIARVVREDRVEEREPLRTLHLIVVREGRPISHRRPSNQTNQASEEGRKEGVCWKNGEAQLERLTVLTQPDIYRSGDNIHKKSQSMFCLNDFNNCFATFF